MREVCRAMRAKANHALGHRSVGVSATVIHLSFNIPLVFLTFPKDGVLIRKMTILGEGKTLHRCP